MCNLQTYLNPEIYLVPTINNPHSNNTEYEGLHVQDYPNILFNHKISTSENLSEHPTWILPIFTLIHCLHQRYRY